MFEVFFNRANSLYEKGSPFAMAVVVRREAPISGQAGDKAIIEADGSIHGWIGGGCTQPIIIQEAQRALRDGRARLVRITPTSSETPQDGIIEYAMTCQSGGVLDIYIEPVMPKPRLVIVGHSAVALALARLAKAINYRVVAVALDATSETFPGADEVHSALDPSRLNPGAQTCVVVSTQGEGDEEALLQVSHLDVAYAAFVASRTKAKTLLERLEEAGRLGPHWRKIKVPAGIDIRARTPEEIAVSILAEVIQTLGAARAEEVEEPEATVGTTHKVLSIEGMSCHHCVVTVRNALRALDGVAVHEVKIGSAAISYDPEVVDRAVIVASVQERGYRVATFD